MVFVDAHAVVVEHDDEVFRLRFGGEHRLEGKPVAEGGVADERDHLVAFPAQVARVAVADARRDGGAAVAGDKGVVSAFGRVGEPARAPLRAQRIQAPAREQFVHIALMPYVEDELILREIEHLVKGERKLDHAEIGGEVAAARAHAGYELPAQLCRQLSELLYVHAFEFFCEQSLYPFLLYLRAKAPDNSFCPIVLLLRGFVKAMSRRGGNGLRSGRKSAIILRERRKKCLIRSS